MGRSSGIEQAKATGRCPFTGGFGSYNLRMGIPERGAVDATYGVLKLPSDAPHWSSNGH